VSRSETRSYPRSMVCNGALIEFRHMTPADAVLRESFCDRLTNVLLARTDMNSGAILRVGPHDLPPIPRLPQLQGRFCRKR
jgi:hypothetical protein